MLSSRCSTKNGLGPEQLLSNLAATAVQLEDIVADLQHGHPLRPGGRMGRQFIRKNAVMKVADEKQRHKGCHR